jgi:hypothetical protein
MAVPFVVYDQTSRKVLRTGVCQNGMIPAQAHNAGEAVLQTDAQHDPDKIEIVGDPPAVSEKPLAS